VRDATNSVVAAIEDGVTLMEVEFPAVPANIDGERGGGQLLCHWCHRACTFHSEVTRTDLLTFTCSLQEQFGPVCGLKHPVCCLSSAAGVLDLTLPHCSNTSAAMAWNNLAVRAALRSYQIPSSNLPCLSYHTSQQRCAACMHPQLRTQWQLSLEHGSCVYQLLSLSPSAIHFLTLLLIVYFCCRS
jgi:hypothetical protein